jgi:Tfp pilus assembly protein PilX
MYSVKYSLQSQSGITLIISLVLLLLLTIIGVSSMKVSNLQEKMAGNDRDRNLAFQAAEAALRAAQRHLEEFRYAEKNIHLFCNTGANPVDPANNPGLFHQVKADGKTSVDTDADAFCTTCASDCTEPDIYAAATWADNNKTIPFETGNTLLAKQPRYFITYIETHISPKAEINKYFPPIYTFMVTARGTGAQDASEVILRSYIGGSTEFAN